MQQIPLLQEVAVVAAVAVLVAVLLGRLHLPTVAGLLFSGALIGPHGFGLASDIHAIEVIAEVGVVLLLFTIGLEFSLARLRHILKAVAVGGLIQVGGTIAVTVAIALAFGRTPGAAVFLGFVFALSSTAIVLRGLAERRELDAPHGRFIVGALIFQDLCVVPMVLLVPQLGGEEGSALSILFALGKAVVVVVVVLALSRVLVPRVLRFVDASRSREVFLLAVLAVCVGTAWLTSLAGLSLALGAFLGGMVVADTQFSHRAMGDILPLRDVFVSFFFVSLGMFFDVQVLFAHPWLVLALFVGFVFGKGMVATIAALLMRFPARAAWLAGVGLAQFGEFGFVLVRLGTQTGAITQAQADPLLNAGIISMFITPLLIQRAPHFTAGERLLAPLAKLLRAQGIEQQTAAEEAIDKHVIIVGYGVAGRLVASALEQTQVPRVILELNAETVRQARDRGAPIFYADATSEEALGHAHIDVALGVLVLINDPDAARRVVDTVKRVAPHVPIFIRTRYLAEQEALHKLGASNVVAEELEAGVELLARILRQLDFPRNVIDEQVHLARASTQASARTITVPRPRFGDIAPLSEIKVESVQVQKGSVGAARSPRDLNLRAETGALLVAVRRDSVLMPHPDPNDVLQVGDIVYLLGDISAVGKAVALLGETASEPSG